jgi:hypothetical protein
MHLRTPIARLLACAAACASLMAPAAHASQPAMWHYADENDFRRGNIEGLALHPTLGLSVAPHVQRTDVDAEFVHCWLRDAGKLYLGTGLQGKIFVIEAGKARLLAKVEAPLVASMVADGTGGVYAGLVGKGEIVHVAADGKVSPVVKLMNDKKGDEGQDKPDAARHIWALVKKGGTLYAGTGPGGRVYAVDIATSTAKVYAETGADHVIALLQDGEALLAGTSDPATLVRIDGEKKVLALASFPGVEVRSLAKSGKTIYAAVNGGQTAVPLASLKATAERPGTSGAPKGPSSNKTGKDGAAKGKGAVWKRTEDGLVQRVFVSPEGMLSEIGVTGKTVVAGAARGGRVVLGDDFGDVESLFDLKEEEVLGLEMGAKGPQTLFTGKGAAVYTVGQGEGGAIFTTEALAETGSAIWGRVETVGEGPLEVESRSGFSDVPNDTWSPWQAAREGKLVSPPANYLQVRVKLGAANARLTELKIFRQVANRAPMVTKIDATVNKGKGTISLAWQAEDPDGDTLGFTVRYRGRGTKQWLILHDRLYDKKTMELSPTDMPDGWYELRVEVTDLPSNGPKTAKSTARISKTFLVDRGRPDVTAEAKGRMVTGLASDAISRIVKVEVSLDGEPALLASARDGIFDQAHEPFEIELPPHAATGPHTVLIQATDENGNTGALRLTLGQ